MMAFVLVKPVVILLDVIAFGLGVAAEQRRSRSPITIVARARRRRAALPCTMLEPQHLPRPRIDG